MTNSHGDGHSDENEAATPSQTNSDDEAQQGSQPAASGASKYPNVRTMTVKDIISGMKRRRGAIPMPSTVQRRAERRKRRRQGNQNVSDDAQAENDPAPQSESDRTDVVVAPQVTLDEDGNIVIDQSSLVVSAGNTINPEKERSNVTTEENLAVGSRVTSASYSKRESSVKWEPAETEKFYNALRTFGTDFSLMEQLFPGRSRRQLKLKFKREERENGDKIDFAMRNRAPPSASEPEKASPSADQDNTSAPEVPTEVPEPSSNA